MANRKNTNDKCKEIAKDLEITKEIKKINILFKDLNKDVKKTVDSLIQNAAYMAVTLRELQETLNQNGMITEYQNGENQWGTKKSPEVEIYNTMVKNFISAMKALNDYLPKGNKKNDDDDFDDFVSSK
ncbi:hypothetical protein IO99_13770 [Clostridium sulfidigenes]|uniref:Terminase n=1 Tax=Clostridium sulfidigenes TaxID=318464 RepID=A0A084J9C5_9CLOT|nr:P27 family phage terminase small subunit [Clostridium sulfidigenes]KEZ85559.1 hypothetical protein IO99_13770 [Clostridium sulfidigenes]